MSPARFRVDSLRIEVHEDRRAMGEAAARLVAGRIGDVLASAPRVGLIFAAAPSQNEFLDALGREPGVDWVHVTAFHMDEYVGLGLDAPQSFARFLRERLFERVKPGRVHYLDGAADAEAEMARYSRLLEEEPPDITCCGIGENGHLAFNDPPFARLDDDRLVKLVTLDEVSRRQQVNDGCFEELARVPKEAITLTIPALLRAALVSCVVPGERKAKAVEEMLFGPVGPACPASFLRLHADATLFLERDSAQLVRERLHPEV